MEQVGDVADADAPPLLIASQIGALSQVAESSAQCVSAMTEECGHVVSGLSDVYAETTQLRETLAQLVSVMVGMSDAERAQTQTQEVDSAELSRQLSVQTALIAQVFEIVKEGGTYDWRLLTLSLIYDACALCRSKERGGRSRG